jgi:hypothetical protein
VGEVLRVSVLECFFGVVVFDPENGRQVKYRNNAVFIFAVMRA